MQLPTRSTRPLGRAWLMLMLMLMLSLAAAGCAGSQAVQLRTLVVPLGKPLAACAGTENLLRGGGATKITRSLTPDEGCMLEIATSATLLDVAELSAKLPQGTALGVKRVALRFEPLMLTDEVGSPIAVTLPELSFELRAGSQLLWKTVGKGTQNPLAPAKTATFEAGLRKLLETHLARHAPLAAQVQARVQIDSKTRQALGKAARGPLFELRFTVTVETEPRAAGDAVAPATSAPATPPGFSSAPAASAPAASAPAAPASAPATR